MYVLTSSKSEDCQNYWLKDAQLGLMTIAQRDLYVLHLDLVSQVLPHGVEGFVLAFLHLGHSLPDPLLAWWSIGRRRILSRCGLNYLL